MKTAPDGCRIHHWRGQSREADIAALADAIAAEVELYNRDGATLRRNDQGEPVPFNLATFRELVDRRICAVRLVERDGKWVREYFSYAFQPKPRTGPATMANPNPDAGSEFEPDDKALEQIFRHELLPRLPKVTGG